MIAGIWKARIESELSSVERDLSDMVRAAKLFLQGLNTSERFVLLGLALIGVLYLFLGHFQGRDDSERAGVHFVGLLFVMVAVAAGFGWTISDHAA